MSDISWLNIMNCSGCLREVCSVGFSPACEIKDFEIVISAEAAFETAARNSKSVIKTNNSMVEVLRFQNPPDFWKTVRL